MAKKNTESNADKREARLRSRSAARLHAVQALYQMEISGAAVSDIIREFGEYRFGLALEDEENASKLEEADATLFQKLIKDSFSKQAIIDQMTDRALVAKWPIARIDPVLRGVFRAAGAELLDENKPPKMVISEFVDIARAFFPEGREPAFVNAVLDFMAREARPDSF